MRTIAHGRMTTTSPALVYGMDGHQTKIPWAQTARGNGDASATAYPGFYQEEGGSSDGGTSSDTSSDSGNEDIDLSDAAGMHDQYAG